MPTTAPQFPPDVYLEGAITRQSGLSREHQGLRAILNALSFLFRFFDSEAGNGTFDSWIGRLPAKPRAVILPANSPLSSLAGITNLGKVCGVASDLIRDRTSLGAPKWKNYRITSESPRLLSIWAFRQTRSVIGSTQGR